METEMLSTQETPHVVFKSPASRDKLMSGKRFLPKYGTVTSRFQSCGPWRQKCLHGGGKGAACYTLVYLRRKINIFFCSQERIFKFKVSFCQHSHGWHIELFTSFSFHLEPVFLGIRIIMMRIQSSCLKQIRIRLFIIKNTISITLYRFHFLNIFNASWYFFLSK